MNISLWILVQLKLSKMLINITTWIQHFILFISSKFSHLSNGVGTQIFQENSLSLQNQDFSTIGITRDPSLMFFLSKTRISIIHGCSISHPSISYFPSPFCSTIDGLILVQLLRSSQNPSWMAIQKSSFVTSREFSAFPSLLFFFSKLVLLG